MTHEPFMSVKDTSDLHAKIRLANLFVLQASRVDVAKPKLRYEEVRRESMNSVLVVVNSVIIGLQQEHRSEQHSSGDAGKRQRRRSK